MKQITPHIYQLQLSNVNAYLAIKGDDVVLIDSGSVSDEEKLVSEIKQAGFGLDDLTAIIITHYHSDHSGNGAYLANQTSVPIYMHPIDAPYVQRGETPIPVYPAPGIITGLIYRFVVKSSPTTIKPFHATNEINDSDVIDVLGGLEVIHVPGHTAGQVALLWRDENALFAADAAANVMRLGYTPGYDDVATAKQSLKKLTKFKFDSAFFGHGNPITANAQQQFIKQFS